ncbi:response regulator [Labrenzia sp. 011]|uniref:response regulator n=1 Tax=Labrenzia sp. 011 TaxID=2171494 RepID=UPI000D5253FE|nr:response regulator [Labrenzia sp. 011]PVB62387.1 hypothetical protein DCO57_06405 [Labrenzia sp. 011]
MPEEEEKIAPRVLVVEDETALAEIMRDYFIDADMAVDHLDHGTPAVEAILCGSYDLIVLDLMLPGKDGLEICREVRQSSDVAIIMVTAKVEEIDRLIGLELGADDYLCKPFSPRELIARARTVLRRSRGASTEAGSSSSRLSIDTTGWIARLDGKLLNLTRREFQLLEALYRRPGRVFSRSQLLDLAFPQDSEIFDRTIDSHIKNIRHKIKSTGDWDPIRSVYGVGYSFDPE